MKTIILIWIAVTSFASGLMSVDGKGFFPVIVQVVDGESGTPIKGATVRLEGAGQYQELALDPKRHTKILPDSLGKPVSTNAEGVGVVFFFTGFSSRITDGKSESFRPLIGTVIVEYEGKEICRCSLAEWAKKNNYGNDFNAAPWIVVSPPPGNK